MTKLERFEAWLANPCRFGHVWANRRGQVTHILSAERGLPGENIFKNPDGGWLRFERHCTRCPRSEYLRTLDEAGTQGRWDVIEPHHDWAKRTGNGD